MARHTYRDGKWFDKDTGEEIKPVSRADSWKPGSTFQIGVKHTEYTCPITGAAITTRPAHEENLKRHGCRVMEKGEKEAAAKDQAREFEAAVDRTASRMVESTARRHGFI